MYNKINPKNILLMPYRVLSSVSSTVDDLVQNLLKKNEKEYCRKLFSILIAIPTKDRKSFGREVSSLLSANTSFNNKVRILHLLDKTPSENRKLLVEQTVRLISDTTSDEDKIEIFSLLSGIFSEDWKKHIDIEKLITQTLQLTSESITDKKTLLFALYDLLVNEPTINTEIIVTQSLRLISSGMSISDRVRILKNVATIANQDREAIVDQACQLIPDTMSASDKSEILRTLTSIRGEDREIIVTQSLRLISSGMSISDRINILRKVDTIANQDREAIIDQACELISDTMSASDKIEILSILSSVRREDRESIAPQVIRLLSDDTDRSDPLFITNIRNLILYFNFIPREERELIVTQALLLISNANISTEERFNLIGILFSMPRENREIMVTQAQQLISDTTYSGRETIIEQSLRLIAHVPDSMSSFERIMVFALINELPIENREHFIEQAIPFISNTTSANESTEVIIAQARQLITDSMSTIQRLTIFQMLTQVPIEDREAFLVQFSQEISLFTALTGEIPINHDQQRIMIIAGLITKLMTVFQVNSNEINENPIKVIINLFDMLNRSKRLLLPLSIKYTNSEGIDAGGITRSFITDLTNAFSKSDDLVTKGELGVIPSMGKDNSSLSIEDQKKCFKIMGRFFSAAIQKHQSIVIGRHFNPIVFEMIFSLNKDDFTEENFVKTFDKLLSIYLKKEFKLEEKDVKNILEDNLSEEFKDVHCIDSKDSLIKSYQVDKKINATLIIAKSMYDSLSKPTDWDSLKGDSVDNFHEKIEGTLSNNAVVNAFRSNGSADVTSFKYIKKWSQNANPELLQKLVKAISGATMLTADTEFNLINRGDEVNKLPIFHTCNFTVELSKYSSYEEFKEKLELSLTYCFEESGFQLG